MGIDYTFDWKTKLGLFPNYTNKKNLIHCSFPARRTWSSCCSAAAPSGLGPWVAASSTRATTALSGRPPWCCPPAPSSSPPSPSGPYTATCSPTPSDHELLNPICEHNPPVFANLLPNWNFRRYAELFFGTLSWEIPSERNPICVHNQSCRFVELLPNWNFWRYTELFLWNFFLKNTKWTNPQSVNIIILADLWNFF